MAVHQYPVEVQPDHLEKITRAKPVQALSELVWNGLDADAKRVSVTFQENDLGALDRVTIKDDGIGLPYTDAPERFRRLGAHGSVQAVRLRQDASYTGKRVAEDSKRFRSAGSLSGR